MKRRFRLTRSNDIKRVRRVGKSYAHTLVVLVTTKSSKTTQRIAIITGKSVGGAVERNRVRRQLRAICDKLLPDMKPGFEAVLIARGSSSQAAFEDLVQAVTSVIHRASLSSKPNE